MTMRRPVPVCLPLVVLLAIPASIALGIYNLGADWMAEVRAVARSRR